ncbi:hypothetical protein [Baekduia sp. Peel2402]|uniref:hypothetical protein n=1 Tax=Baekduia sp. Peel2402 TaxID=3458296 RepID=UPI00403E5DE2
MTAFRKDSSVRRFAAILAALCSIFVAAPAATAAPISFPADPGFSGSSWTPTAACGLLCTVSGLQPSTGGNPGGYARAEYATVANVLGLAGGYVDFTSAAFSWTGDSPQSATLHFDRKTSIATLLSLNGTVGTTVGLVDSTAGTTTTIKSLTYSSNVATWTGMDVTVPPSLLVAGHSYKLAFHTTFNAAVAVLGGAWVGFDNVSLSATRASASVSGVVVGTPSQTAVSIGATLNTAGVDGTYHVEYGHTTAYGLSTSDQVLLGSASPGPIGVNLSGLTAGTTYHARLVVTTDAGTTYGPDVSFTTAASGGPVTPPTPSVGTVTADVKGARAVDLSAVVGLNGIAGAQYRFEYGATTSYGANTSLTAVPAAGSNGWSALAASLSSLAPGSTYHVRVAVLDGSTWTYGNDITFTTAPAQAPTVGATAVTASDTTAQVAADVTPNSADTQWVVEYGPTNTYGSSSTPVTLPAGSTPTRAVYDITGLTPDSDYHVRIKATSADGTTYGADTVIHTAADPNQVVTVPTVGTTIAVPTSRAAALSAVVDLNGLSGADYRFEFGTTTAYGSATPVTAVPAAGAGGTSALIASLSGLTPGGTYHVRASVRVNGTWTNGPDVTFTANPAVAPLIANVVATQTATTARLTADVTAHSAATQWHLEYGSTNAYGSVSSALTLPAGSGAVPVSVTLAGLTPDSDVHYRFVATSVDGSATTADRVIHTDADGGGTEAEGIDGGGDTTSNGGSAVTMTTPVTPALAATPAPAAKPAAVAAPACRAVTILGRSRGMKVTMERFVTDGAPLAITAGVKAKNATRVTIDGKRVKVKTKGRAVRLAAAQLKAGRHVIVVGTGKRAARLRISVGTCKAALGVRAAGGRARVVLAVVPGTTAATFTLPKAYIKALAAGTVSVRSDSRTATAKIAKRTKRNASTVTITGLPRNVTEVRLTLTTKARLKAAGVTATATSGTKIARLKARTVGIR